MTTKRSRLKPWPVWAGTEYEAGLVAIRRLRLECQEGLWRLGNGDYNPPLNRLMRRLPQHARDANLAGLTALALKREHRGERWPRWAVQALHELTEGSGRAIHQAKAARSALHRRDLAEVERLLTLCLAAAQEIELLLLAGPPPEGVAVSELEV